MALTQVNSNGLKDDSIVNADLKSDAAIAASKLSGVMPTTGGTLTGDLALADNVKVKFGAGNDFALYHDSSASLNVIDATGHDLEIRHNAEKMITCADDGAITLFHDNVEVFQSNSNGFSVRGPEGGAAEITFTADEGDDNADKWKAGTSDGGPFYIGNKASGGWETNIECNGNGNVELYFDNTARISTTNVGGHVEGNWDLSAGHLYIDQAYKAVFGAGDELAIYFDGTNSYVDSDTGKLRLNSVGGLEINATYLNVYKADGSETIAEFTGDGACNLFHNNVKQFYTQSGGSRFVGRSEHDGGIRLTDTREIQFGDTDGGDAKIYHDGSNTRFNNSVGSLILNCDSFNVKKQDNSENIIIATADAGIELYHNNSLKLYTQSDGVDIRGWIRPETDNLWDVGHPSYRWDDIRASNGSIVTSDRNEKENITVTDLGLSFVNKLTPVSYKRKGKTRTHYGLVAQDVETLLSDISKPTSGFAGFIKDDIPDELYDDRDTLPEGKKVGDIKKAAYTTYGLRYTEFISPLIKATQELSAEVETLKTEVAALKAG